MAGDPDRATFERLLAGLPQAGAISSRSAYPSPTRWRTAGDPGRRAAALKAGMTLKGTLELVRGFRRTDATTPIILMGYYNPIYRWGAERFVGDAKEAGVDGLIIVDLPPEEDRELCDPAMAGGLDFIRLTAPTTDEQRLPVVLRRASGFVYFVSITGITGTRSATTESIAANVARLRRFTDLPVVVGFGIKTPAQAAEIARIADAVAVGSALVQRIADAKERGADAAPRCSATSRRWRRACGRRAHELAHQLRPAEDSRGRREEGGTRQPLGQVSQMRADAVPPGARAKSLRLPQLRPSHAARPEASHGHALRRGAIHADRAAEDGAGPAEIPRPQTLCRALERGASATRRRHRRAHRRAWADRRPGGAVVAAFDFAFMGGSMGIAVGDGLLAAARLAVLQEAALVVVPASGGARMQEGILSLMQMPRSVLAVEMVKEAKLPTSSCSAIRRPAASPPPSRCSATSPSPSRPRSSASPARGHRGDDPREAARRLPAREYLLEHGMVDMVVPRAQLRETLARLLDLLAASFPGAEVVPLPTGKPQPEAAAP